ncbi:MAG: hypothetical protein IT210_23440 [Armatimonadetes bacterium]|nr:hypothetical protein [Armatimonadota bacterium]
MTCLEEAVRVGLSHYTVNLLPMAPFITDLVITGRGAYDDPKDFGMLEPTIEYLWMDKETDILHIYGEFGTQAGRVTVEGSPAANVIWNSTHIQCASMPRKGAGSFGKIMVEVNGHKSNPR